MCGSAAQLIVILTLEISTTPPAALATAFEAILTTCGGVMSVVNFVVEFKKMDGSSCSSAVASVGRVMSIGELRLAGGDGLT